MSIIKSFSVGNGDTFYIKHGSDNFTMVDCNLTSDNKEKIINEIIRESKEKGIFRFVSTHPDEDHFHGIEELTKKVSIPNFYCVENNAIKADVTESFKKYCELRDSDKSYYISKDCSRKWMNCSSDERGSSGINVLWPDTQNQDFKTELALCNEGIKFNNISPIIRYAINEGASAIWFGDMETEYMEKIVDKVSFSETTIVFAPHHGRRSGRIPTKILDELKPRLIIIGEAPSEDIAYYSNYNTITQNSCGDLKLDCIGEKLYIYCSNDNYSVKFLDNDWESKDQDGLKYLGTLAIKEAELV